MTPVATVELILRLLALCLFVIGAWMKDPAPDRLRLLSAGLAFLTASFIGWPIH